MSNRIQKIGRGFSAFFDAFASAQSAAARYNRLSRMSDSQLARHGIERMDIPHVVMKETIGG